MVNDLGGEDLELKLADFVGVVLGGVFFSLLELRTGDAVDLVVFVVDDVGFLID